MALPRKLVQALKAGTYQPSKIGSKARQAATRLQTVSGPTRPPGVQRSLIKTNMKVRKHRIYNDVLGFNPRSSARAVDNSDATDEMAEALTWSEDRLDEYASRASQAHRLVKDTGSAGNLSDYLVYDFLFYH